MAAACLLSSFSFPLRQSGKGRRETGSGRIKGLRHVAPSPPLFERRCAAALTAIFSCFFGVSTSVLPTSLQHVTASRSRLAKPSCGLPVETTPLPLPDLLASAGTAAASRRRPPPPPSFFLLGISSDQPLLLFPFSPFFPGAVATRRHVEKRSRLSSNRRMRLSSLPFSPQLVPDQYQQKRFLGTSLGRRPFPLFPFSASRRTRQQNTKNPPKPPKDRLTPPHSFFFPCSVSVCPRSGIRARA